MVYKETEQGNRQIHLIKLLCSTELALIKAVGIKDTGGKRFQHIDCVVVLQHTFEDVRKSAPDTYTKM